jgi:D-glycero-D-manno-heptose 1,7-bisphosphate phosphatase
LVILAGGYGTRLAPITSSIPKPLLRVGNRAFIDHLISQAFSLGFKKILVLAGHNASLLEEHFKQAEFKAMDIQILTTPPEYNSKERLIAAKNKLQENFFLVYGDNLVQFLSEELNSFFEISNSKIKCIGFNGIGYHNFRNLHLGSDGSFLKYEKRISEVNSNTLLNLGWYSLSLNQLSDIFSHNGDLESSIFSLFNKFEITVQEVKQKYYSIGEPSRLAAISRFLDPNRRCLLLDRDGTLNERAPEGEYILDWNKFQWRNSVVDALGNEKFHSIEKFIVTNQPAVGRGLSSEAIVNRLHREMLADLERNGSFIDCVSTCFHGWNDGCSCRKPGIGLFLELQHLFDLNWSNSVYIGDDERDRLASNRLNLNYIDASSVDFNLTDSLNTWLAGKYS